MKPILLGVPWDAHSSFARGPALAPRAAPAARPERLSSHSAPGISASTTPNHSSDIHEPVAMPSCPR